jgi:hypothetical protein
MKLIFWCDAHAGFISAILSLLTIFISTLALIISSQISKIPYKKRMAVIPGYYEENGEPVINMMIVNYGLTALVIDNIYILDEKRTHVGTTFEETPIIIKPSQYKRIKFSMNDENGLIGKNVIDLNGHMTIVVHEYGGREYKFKNGFPVG